ncbi:iron dicitrate transport regulator FecR [Caulobacter flavus]|uniref:Iron dicitrate transport regulator FecR n=1 Tax=Caulobacter flavus TaxID=1679497 RepID=A0A2N5CM11_9CAUL|nr:DUF4880 domain-containing protein [Caulobacter flavus]AYV48151.1 iron dicitrate transport regulator FecR [Caulobacter flavus]PLR06924.1 iron dicitrate transport regulator FecR [Caulobacter flavus]
MSAPITDSAALDPIEARGLEWINRALSGQMTPEEVDELARWRAEKPDHEAAFVEAVRFRRAVRDAVLEARAQPCAPSTASETALRPPRAARKATMSRRAMIGGSIAASVVGGYAVLRSSDDIWSAATGDRPDYRVDKGQRRSIAVASGVSAEFNTQTRASVDQTARGAEIKLISGEAAVAARTPVVIKAGLGETSTRDGRVNVRQDGATVCVTCIAGEARVARGGQAVTLTSGSQVVYDRKGLGGVHSVDPGVAVSWLSGLLVFRDAPLQQVVDEINRYRRGRIVLVDPALGRRPVYGVFQISRIDGAAEQVRRLTGAKITRLPGGLVLVS